MITGDAHCNKIEREKKDNSYLEGHWVKYMHAKLTFIKDLSYTLGQRRTHFQYRAAATASSAAELKEKLSLAKVSKTRDRVIAFVFTGQGAQ